MFPAVNGTVITEFMALMARSGENFCFENVNGAAVNGLLQ